MRELDRCYGNIILPKSTEKLTIRSNGFFLNRIYYCGSSSDANQIKIIDIIGISDSFAREYVLERMYYYSPTMPDNDGYIYWRYVDGIPTVWE